MSKDAVSDKLTPNFRHDTLPLLSKGYQMRVLVEDKAATDIYYSIFLIEQFSEFLFVFFNFQFTAELFFILKFFLLPSLIRSFIKRNTLPTLLSPP